MTTDSFPLARGSYRASPFPGICVFFVAHRCEAISIVFSYDSPSDLELDLEQEVRYPFRKLVKCDSHPVEHSLLPFALALLDIRTLVDHLDRRVEVKELLFLQLQHPTLPEKYLEYNQRHANPMIVYLSHEPFKKKRLVWIRARKGLMYEGGRGACEVCEGLKNRHGQHP